MKTKPTYHDGANDERTAWMARVKRLTLKHDQGLIDGGLLLVWGSKRVARNKKRKGGL